MGELGADLQAFKELRSAMSEWKQIYRPFKNCGQQWVSGSRSTGLSRTAVSNE
jgi:hypothetical protein